VGGGVGVAVGEELLEGHAAVAEPGGDLLPVVGGELGGLLHVSQVVLGRHDFDRVVHAADDEGGSVGVQVRGGPLAAAAEPHRVTGLDRFLGDMFAVGDEAGGGEGHQGLADGQGPHVVVEQAHPVQLFETGAALPSAGRAGDKYLPGPGIEEAFAGASGGVKVPQRAGHPRSPWSRSWRSYSSASSIRTDASNATN
jgi:hypothetical protein